MMIAARNAFLMSGAKTPTARDYVQDGLVAMWDAIENVGFGVSDHTDGRMVNLVGSDTSLDFVLASGSVFGSDYVTSTTSSPFASNSSKAKFTSGTAEVVFTPTTEAGYNGAFLLGIGNAYSETSLHFMIQYDDTRGGVLQPNRVSGGKRYAIFSSTAATGVRYTLSCVLANTVVMTDAYCNGSGLAVQGDVAYSMYAFTTNGILGGQATERKIPGWRIHCVRLYSRALTAAEVAANYAVDAARFGL